MKRRSFLRHAAALPILGGGIIAAASVKSDADLKAQIEHHAEALRRLIEQTKPDGVGEAVIKIFPSAWEACEPGLGKNLNPNSMRWN